MSKNILSVYDETASHIGYFDDNENKFIPNENYTRMFDFHKKNNSGVDVMINIAKIPIDNKYYTYYSFAEKLTDRTIIFWKGTI